jgi:hypothetical protein
MVSCAKKHTILLDSSNKMWYFGSKEAVGVVSHDKVNQFDPIRLTSNEDRGFVFVSAGE